MDSPNRTPEPQQALTVTPTSETTVFIRQTSVPVEHGCLKCGKRTAEPYKRIAGVSQREPKSWAYKLCKFIRSDYKTVLLSVGGTLSIAFGIALIVKYYLPSSSTNAHLPNGVPVLLGSQHNVTKQTSHVNFTQPPIPVSPPLPPPSPKEKPTAAIVYALNDLNNLPASAKSVVIKSLILTGRQAKNLQRSVDAIRENPNVLTLEIDAGGINRRMLVQILNRFTKVQTLSLNIDKLCVDDDSEDTPQPTNLDNVHSFRIVHAHKCKSTLQWILSWNIHHIRRLVMCDTDFTESSTFENLRGFVNATSTELEEMVVQESDFCEGCTFQGLNLRLGQITDVTVEKGSGKEHEEVACVY